MTTQNSQSDNHDLRFESFDDIESELGKTLQGYAMANPASFFDRTDAQFKMVATAFIERLRAADRRENQAYVTTRVKEAELLARIDEQERTGSFKYDDGDVEIRVYHPTGQYMQQDIRIAELKAQQEEV